MNSRRDDMRTGKRYKAKSAQLNPSLHIYKDIQDVVPYFHGYCGGGMRLIVSFDTVANHIFNLVVETFLRKSEQWLFVHGS